ncbi:polyphenol oxidase family protein [Nonomuraea sp. NPDC049129]|uniref:polyphenol oxidase family protein n=1 Tax=Nonomuraea sp. NPDC049129 TaxID=3155272 RepID=UPI0033FA3E96
MGDAGVTGSDTALLGRGEILSIGNIRMAFTDRYAGVSLPPVEIRRLGKDGANASRRRAAESLGLDPDRVVYMKQVHGGSARYVTRPFGEDAPPLDATCTTETGLALVVLVADCAAVLLADARRGVVGAAHAGRLGTAAMVVPHLLEVMIAHGADPASMTAVVGPTICRRCYEVPLQMRDEMAALVPCTSAVSRHGTPSIDLRSGIEGQLRAAGISDVRHDRRCNAESPELFSHRREGATGDCAGYVWMEPTSKERHL